MSDSDDVVLFDDGSVNVGTQPMAGSHVWRWYPFGDSVRDPWAVEATVIVCRQCVGEYAVRGDAVAFTVEHRQRHEHYGERR